MGTRVVKELVYDAPVEQVSAMLQDPAFRERSLERMKVLRGGATAQDGVVTIEQVQAARGLPSFVTKLVGEEIRIVQVERWTGVDHADVQVSIPGKPGEMTGTITLVGTGDRTVETVHLDITVRVPLVGGKMESVVAEMFGKALTAEHRTGVEWLSRP